MQPETPRDRSSLRDFAKLAAPAGPTAGAPARGDSRRPSADSSGVVDLEALMKEHPSWLDDALSRAKGGTASMPSSSSLSALAAPVLLAPPSLAPTSFDEVPIGVPKSSIALIAATVGAIALVVAATGFALKMQTKGGTHVAAAIAAPVMPASHVEDTIPPPPPVTEVATAPAAAAPAKDDTMQANASAPAVPTEDAVPSRHGHGHGHGVHHAALARSAAAAPEPVAPEAKAPIAAKPAKATSALDAALRGAVGPAAAAPANAPSPASVAASAPPISPSGDRPDRPSGSAVTSALTSALPGARACLASGAEPSHARVTFGSSGNVQSVDVTGPAGSDSKATSCMRAAFGHAHVPAFSQSTYAAGVTVRPR